MPRNWTDDEKVEIQTLSDEGLSLKEIGARFSVSDDTIRGVLRRKRGAEIEPPRQPIACVRYTKNSIGKCQSGAHRVPFGLLRKIPLLKRPLASPDQPPSSTIEVVQPAARTVLLDQAHQADAARPIVAMAFDFEQVELVLQFAKRDRATGAHRA